MSNTAQRIPSRHSAGWDRNRRLGRSVDEVAVRSARDKSGRRAIGAWCWWTCVIGIDPDRDGTTASVVRATTGGEQASATFETTRSGYEQLIVWADRYTNTASRVWTVEDAGSYGAGVCSHLVDAGEHKWWSSAIPAPRAQSARGHRPGRSPRPATRSEHQSPDRHLRSVPSHQRPPRRTRRHQTSTPQPCRRCAIEASSGLNRRHRLSVHQRLHRSCESDQNHDEFEPRP